MQFTLIKNFLSKKSTHFYYTYQKHIFLFIHLFYSYHETLFSKTRTAYKPGEGEIGVYARHLPITTTLEPGIVKIHEEGTIKEAAVLH